MTTFHDVARLGYQRSEDDETWVDDIARAASSLFGRPVLTYLLRLHDVPERRLAAVSRHEGPFDHVIELARETHAQLSSTMLRQLYFAGPFARLWSERMSDGAGTGRDPSGLPPSLATYGENLLLRSRDILGIYGGSADGGCMVCVPSTGPVGPRTRWAARRLAVHLHAAFRLREAREREPDAILDERGIVLEERGGAVADEAPAVAEGVEERRRAERLARAGDERALDVWRGLVAGRWSLVEASERSGRRTLVLRRNELAEVSPEDDRWRRPTQVAALVARGHSNKFIAYQLGLPISTVASDLKCMLERLGLESRAELVRMSGSGGGAGSPNGNED